MKQNIKSIGQVELDEAELREAAFHYIKEDRTVMTLAITKYLKSIQGFTLTKLFPATFDGGKMSVKCNVEATGRTLPIVNGAKPEGHKKPNQGFYTVLMTILQTAYAKDKKKSLDAMQVYEDMRFELPNLAWRNFTIYVSDKRRQATSGYRYDGKKKLIWATEPGTVFENTTKMPDRKKGRPRKGKDRRDLIKTLRSENKK